MNLMMAMARIGAMFSGAIRKIAAGSAATKQPGIPCCFGVSRYSGVLKARRLAAKRRNIRKRGH